MRENLFRGLDKNLNVWRYGSLIEYTSGQVAIVSYAERYGGVVLRNEVFAETVGQYTGLDDKNGMKIFDGDVVSNGELVRYSTGKERWFGDVGVVRHDTKNGCLVINNDDGRPKRLTVKVIKNNRVTVIGNIHDNPEMTEVTE